MQVVFTNSAKKDFDFFKKNNQPAYQKIKTLLIDIARHHPNGKGKPEKLKGDLAGFWSRRINKKDRLVYHVQNHQIQVISCRYHY